MVFIAHGRQKVTEWGLDGTATAFAGMGVPLPTVDMLGALILVHLPNGLLGQGGYGLVLVLGVAALALGFNGGSLSVTRLAARGKVEQSV